MAKKKIIPVEPEVITSEDNSEVDAQIVTEETAVEPEVTVEPVETVTPEPDPALQVQVPGDFKPKADCVCALCKQSSPLLFVQEGK